jgi:hypothetical protein
MGKERRRKQCVSVILVSVILVNAPLKHSGVLQEEKEKEDSKRLS